MYYYIMADLTSHKAVTSNILTEQIAHYCLATKPTRYHIAGNIGGN